MYKLQANDLPYSETRGPTVATYIAEIPMFLSNYF